MEKNLRLIEIYRQRFQEATRRVSEEVAKPEPSELNGIAEDLSSKWGALYSLYESAINTSENEELDARVNAMEDCRTQYHVSKGLLDVAKEKQSRLNVHLPSRTSEPETSSSHQTVSAILAKLTATRVPSFSGEMLKWPEFWGFYEHTVHNQTNLSSLEKFVRLKEALKGEAAAVIEGLPLTSPNYTAAIELLQAHYGSVDVIIQENFRHLHNLPTVPPGNHKALKQFLFDGEVRIRSLETLGVAYDSYARPFVSHLVDRLPKNLRTAWYRSIAERTTAADVKDVLTFLRKEVISQERSQCSESFNRKRTAVEESCTSQEFKKSRLLPSVATLAAVSKKVDLKNRCVFCHLPHSPLKCTLPLQKRLEVVKQERLCFACLRKGHRVSNCKNPNPDCRKCKRRHHTALCPNLSNESNQDPTSNPMASSTKASISLCAALPKEGGIFLKTATVFLYGPRGKLKATCLIDEGSQRSYTTERVVEELGLCVERIEMLSICSFGSKDIAIPSPVRCLRLEVSGTRNGSERIALNVLARPALCPDLPAPKMYAVTELADRFMADERIASPYPGLNNINLLLGADYCTRVVNYKTISCKSGLLALSSKFGWLVFGQERRPGAPGIVTLSTAMGVECSSAEGENEKEDLRRFWDLEHFGIFDSHHGGKEPNPLIDFQGLISRNSNGRYSVPLPWRANRRELLASNYKQALARYKSLLFRLQKETSLFKAYHFQIQEYLRWGFVSKVEKGSTDHEAGFAYYLPHRPVVRTDAITTKIRPVFDASARGDQGLSLNDCLETGENLNPELLAVLLRFRWNRVAWVGDIEKAFLQVEVNPSDRDALRFLWMDDYSTAMESKEPSIFRWNRVTFGLSPSPFLLRVVIRKHLAGNPDIEPTLARYIEENLYMDDLLAGSQSIEEAHQTILRVTKAFDGACMKLTKWVTNKLALKESLLPSDALASSHTTSCPIGYEENSKILGVVWKPNEDYWTFDSSKLSDLLTDVPERVTKRQMLSISARLFDPLGLSSPVLLRIKLYFQKLWEVGTPWDVPIPEDIQHDWKQVVKGLTDLAKIKVPRWYFNEWNPDMKLELHAFSDASEKAYGAVVYLRSSPNGSFYTNLVASKTRVAPTKKVTLPRLELLGALLASRLMDYIVKALQCSRIICNLWCDSTVALGWIKGPIERWKPFIRNRVEEIRRYSQPHQWRYCPGGENPADLASRGCMAGELLNHLEWFHGPKWLRMAEETWPSYSSPSLTAVDKHTLLSEEKRRTVVAAANTLSHQDLIPLVKYSSFQRVLRITAWVFRYLRNRRKKGETNKEEDASKTTDMIKINKHKQIPVQCLSAKELERTEMFWIRCAQKAAYPKEFEDLRNGKFLSKSSPIQILRPIFDKTHCILRVTSRLADHFAFEEQSPPIPLPVIDRVPDDRIVRLLIWDNHLKMLHAGVSLLLAKLRQHYWLVKGRQQVKRVLGICGRCRRMDARPFAQPMANLPVERTTEISPFLIAGVDFMGPIYVTPLCKHKEIKKVYVCLFVCPVSRAVQLELVSCLSTDTFILALERLVSNRRDVKTLMSDHGAAFAKTARQLQNLKNCPRLAAFLANQRMEWRFIPTHAPWWGGYWERLVRIIKNTLKKSLGFQCLNYEEMLTQVKSTEAIINSRPLARDSDSPDDAPTYISPSDLLIGRRSSSLPSKAKADDFSPTEGAEQLTKRLRHQKMIFDRGWKYWKTYYLQDLCNFAQRNRPGLQKPIRLGQMVMIRDDFRPRFSWRVGLVTQLKPGRDGCVRSVTIRNPSGHYSDHAIQSLYPLETEISHDSNTGEDSRASQPKLRFELPSTGNSRGECKKKKRMGKIQTSDDPSDLHLDATRTLRSGRRHCIRPML